MGCPQGLSQARITIDQNMPRGREVRRTQRPVRLSPDSEHSLKYDDNDNDDDSGDEVDLHLSHASHLPLHFSNYLF